MGTKYALLQRHADTALLQKINGIWYELDLYSTRAEARIAMEKHKHPHRNQPLVKSSQVWDWVCIWLLWSCVLISEIGYTCARLAFDADLGFLGVAILLADGLILGILSVNISDRVGKRADLYAKNNLDQHIALMRVAMYAPKEDHE